MILLTDTEFHEIVAYVREKYGIDLRIKRVLIENRLAGLLTKKKYGSFTELFLEMQADSTESIEREVLSRLTTSYTFFMREKTHFQYVVERILPELPKTALQNGYAIWCAGCATGQECYSLAMELEEFRRRGGFLPDYAILATDISQKALKTAAAGEFSAEEIDGIPEEYRQRYWQQTSQVMYRVSRNIRDNITFALHNIFDGSGQKNTFDSILCRNVLIYFDSASRNAACEIFCSSLKPGGHLLLGHTETILNLKHKFKYVAPAVYKKL